jgi:transposase
MPKKIPTEVRDRAVRMTLDHLADYTSMSAACRDLAPKLNVRVGTFKLTDAATARKTRRG